MDTILAFLAIILIIGSIIIKLYEGYTDHRPRSNRPAKLKALADRWIFMYVAKDSSLHNVVMQQFQLGSHGHDHTITNLLIGSRKRVTIQLFDYYFKTGHKHHIHDDGKTSLPRRTSVVLLQATHLDLPSFMVRKKDMVEKVKKAFNYSTALKIQGGTAFNKACFLTTNTIGNKIAVQSLFDVEIQRFFEQNKEFTVEGNGSNLLVYYHENELTRPDELEAFANQALTLMELFLANNNW